MAFPANPTAGDLHTEGGKSYVAVAAGALIVWQIAPPASGVTLAAGNDTTSTTSAATPANVATQVAAGLDSLDNTNIDAGPAITGVTGTTLQDQLVDMSAQIQANKEITGNNVGTFATNALLNAAVDTDGAALEAGDFAWFTPAVSPATDAGESREAGIYVYNGTAWPQTPVPIDIDAAVGAASDAAAGIVELSTDAEAAAGTDTAKAVTPANLAATEPTINKAGDVLTLDTKIAADKTLDMRRPSVTAFPADDSEYNEIIYLGTGAANGLYFWNGNTWAQP